MLKLPKKKLKNYKEKTDLAEAKLKKEGWRVVKKLYIIEKSLKIHEYEWKIIKKIIFEHIENKYSKKFQEKKITIK